MAFHVYADASGSFAAPQVRRISADDVFDALRSGFSDFRQKPSHYAFLCLVYPVFGLILVSATSGGNAFQLAFPLMSGFALLGPIAAIGLYEISRRRELGMDTDWRHAFAVLRSPAIPSIIALGAMLLVVFAVWIQTAGLIYQGLYADAAPATATAFLADVLTTGRGWALMIVGNAVGLVFALVVLSTTVVAFPLLIDRDAGALAAIRTSALAVRTNPLPMLLWGLIVAVALVVGSIPLLVGLAVVIPVLGHATWHLYRKVVVSSASGKDA